MEQIKAFKVIVVGASGVGKSAMVDRLVTDTFREQNTSTVGVEYSDHILDIDGQPTKLQIWDTAGQERFRSISRAYFRNAIGALLVFDVTKRESFDEVERWLNELHSLAHPNAVIVLAGNKIDLKESREVGIGEIGEFVRSHHLEYFETSAQSGDNITEVFMRLAYEIHARIKSGSITTPTMNQPAQSSRTQEGDACC